MHKYKVKIEPEALADIQGITDWYNDQQAGLGKRFQKNVVRYINSFGKDPQIYAVRYMEIRCVTNKNFLTWCISTLTLRTKQLKFWL